jgi:hypothetical protein
VHPKDTVPRVEDSCIRWRRTLGPNGGGPLHGTAGLPQGARREEAMTEGRWPEAEDERARQHEAEGGDPDDLERRNDAGDITGVPLVAMSGTMAAPPANVAPGGDAARSAADRDEGRSERETEEDEQATGR